MVLLDWDVLESHPGLRMFHSTYLEKKKGKSEMDSFRFFMHKKPKILTVVGV